MTGIKIILALSTFAIVCVSSTIIDKFNNWKDKFSIKFKNDDHFNLVLEKWIENSESVNKYLYNGVINNAVCLPHSKIMILPKRAQQIFFFFVF